MAAVSTLRKLGVYFQFQLGKFKLPAWTYIIVALATRLLSPVYAVALCPIWTLQAFQHWTGLGQKDALRARLCGFRVLRLDIVALALANLVLA